MTVRKVETIVLDYHFLNISPVIRISINVTST